MRGMAWRALLVVVALAVVDVAAARFVVEKNRLHVTSPDELRGTYDCALGNFGVPEHGGFLHGRVLYPRSNRKACQSFDGISFKLKFGGGRPNLVLIDRGECFFTDKARNAQNAGAAAILIVDDKNKPLITMDSPEESKEYLKDITIPTALISKTLGDKLKKSVENGDMLSVVLSWSEALPHNSDELVVATQQRRPFDGSDDEVVELADERE